MSFLRRLCDASIWHPDAIPVLELKYGSVLKRRVFPAVDLVCIAMGVWGAHFGLPSVDTTYGGIAGRVGGLVFAIFGAVALLGIAFPRLAVMEILAKCLLGGCLVTYGLLVMLTANNADDPSRAYVLGLIAIALCLFSYRLSILRQERASRHVAAALDAREDQEL